MDATVLNEYAAAVGLFFYALFPDHISLYENDEGHRKSEKPWGLLLNDPALFYRGKIDTVLRSAYSILFKYLKISFIRICYFNLQ